MQAQHIWSEMVLRVGVNISLYPGTIWNENNAYLGGYYWQDIPVYNPDVDGENKYGSSFGLPRRPFVGGYWIDGSVRGSRCILCHDFVSSMRSYTTTRGCIYAFYFFKI